ncbi:MAG: hypothetical protein IJX69_00465 [Oscillospiraceae bacterium]|nr:hypothetical protein [Oscillospiraceae bacterium]
MPKNKNILSVIALVLALASMAVSVFAVAQARKVSDLEAQLAALTVQNQPTDPNGQETKPAENRILSASLSAAVWADGQGADVTLILEPATYTEGDSAQFQVYLGQELAADLTCVWNGRTYTATAQLPAANGYTYTCSLTGTDGTGISDTISSPENPVATELVYLGDALRAYCNLIPEDWTAADGILTITAAHIQAQLPQLSVSDSLSCGEARLVLRLGEEAVESQSVTLAPGEGSRSFEATAENIAFSLPELGEGDSLELWLEVSLSDGQVLRACGASWYMTEGRLHMAAG